MPRRDALYTFSLIASLLLFLLPGQASAQSQSIIGNLCVGLDCESSESFGTSVLKIKDVNNRILFDDDSRVDGLFPTNDWQITLNSDQQVSNGGSSYFAIEDISGGTVPFFIEAGAPNNALYVSDATGFVGLGTDTPALSVHAIHGNTPGMRMEQDGSSGWTPYVWDVAANETNFFVRDVTGGNTIPFRILDGAENEAVTIAGNSLGIGTTTPAAMLDIVGAQPEVRIRNEGTSNNTFSLDANGNLTLSGVLTEASSMHLKENRAAVDPAAVLETLKDVPVETWNYRTDADGIRHMGPMAQTFYAAFGLGVDEEHLAPLDANGVALAAIQGLLNRVEQGDAALADMKQELTTLRQENESLRERLERLEQVVQQLHPREDESAPMGAPASGDEQ